MVNPRSLAFVVGVISSSRNVIVVSSRRSINNLFSKNQAATNLRSSSIFVFALAISSIGNDIKILESSTNDSNSDACGTLERSFI
jgi:hypothetical protein